MIRAGRDDDAAGIIALVSACWSEYPGCVTDIDGEAPELRSLATYCAERGGAIWVEEADEKIAGLACAYPLADGAWEIGKVYVGSAQRGSGLAHRLLDTAEAHARTQGASRVALWSDTRFDRAHRFYEKRSYVRSGPIRALDDKSNSIEFGYAKPLTGVVVERLDAAAAASAVEGLARVLVACVDDGAAISFLPPLSLEAARAFWRKAAAAVARNEKILLAAWHEGTVVGTVQLDLATPPNQPHRADLAKMMVHPQARRRGVGRAMLDRIEAEGVAAGRTLLTLDTRADDNAEPMYRAAGWIECGRIPNYALSADRTFHDTVLYYKRVG